jgi:hypothetical protein
MSAINLILGRGQPRTKIDVLTLDAALMIGHEQSASLTKNPIEDGSNVTDNVVLDNNVLNITGLVSEAPLSLLGSAFNVFTGVAATKAVQTLGSPFGTITGAAVGSLGGLIARRNPEDVNFPKKAFQFLTELKEKRTPIVIETSLKVYNNMILTKLSVPQDSGKGGSLEFTATFEQIQVVKTSTVLIPEKNVKKSGAASNQNLGKQATKEATEQNKKGSSILFDLYKKIGG